MRHGHDLPRKIREIVEVAGHVLGGRFRLRRHTRSHSIVREKGRRLCGKNQPIPIRHLWNGFNPCGVEKGIFVYFSGYIDESYDKKQKLFALSCMIGKGSQFIKMERLWRNKIRNKNDQRKKYGQKPISRYHAADCNARKGEFHGWDERERNEFVLKLFGVFKQIPLHNIAIYVDLDQLCEAFPEYSGDRLKLAYMLLTDFLMISIGEDFARLGGEPVGKHKVTLFHDSTANGKYDPTILRQFNSTKNARGFPYAEMFTSITALQSKDCALLQPADLVAFEALRHAQHFHEGKKVRKSLEALVALDTFGIHLSAFTKQEHILDLKRKVKERKSQYDLSRTL